MKNRVAQYILIITILSAITGTYFYFKSNAAQKINASKVNNLTSGLVGYWTFDGADISGDTVSDKAGSNTGTLSQGVGDAKPIRTIGKIGQGLIFDGSDSKVNLLSTINTTTTFTVSMWINPNSLGNTYDGQYLFTQGGSTGGIRFNGSSGKISYRFSGSDHLNNTAFSLGNWHHIAVTVNSGIYRFYIDGSDDGGGVGASLFNVSAIGGGSETSFWGQIDEVRYYSRALSQSEITELYQQGQTKINAAQDGKLESGLVVYYTMDGADTVWSGASAGTVTDKSPVGTNTGTLANMSQSTSPVIGKIGQAMYFDGTDDNINNPSPTGLPTGNGLFTISAWINYPASIGGGGKAVVRWGDVASYGNMFGVASNKLRHWFPDGSILTANTTLSYNTWYNAVITYDGTNRRIYLNGTLDCTPDVPAAQTITGTDLYVGYYPLNTSYVKSKIDEVRIYNRALSQSEITELYQQGQAKINASQTNKLMNGLVGYWPMDGNYVNWGDSSSEIKDVLNAYNGNSINMTAANAAIGKIGQALSFNGTNSYIDLGDQAAFDFGTGNFSVHFWAKGQDAIGTPIAKDAYSSGTDNGFLLYADNTQAGSYIYWNGANEYEIKRWPNGDTGITSWHQIVAVREGTGAGQLKLYYDGAPSPTTPTGTESRNLSNARSLRIGAADDGSYFPGSIDEVRVYNRALSASEVTELYNMGR